MMLCNTYRWATRYTLWFFKSLFGLMLLILFVLAIVYVIMSLIAVDGFAWIIPLAIFFVDHTRLFTITFQLNTQYWWCLKNLDPAGLCLLQEMEGVLLVEGRGRRFYLVPCVKVDSQLLTALLPTSIPHLYYFITSIIFFPTCPCTFQRDNAEHLRSKGLQHGDDRM